MTGTLTEHSRASGGTRRFLRSRRKFWPFAVHTGEPRLTPLQYNLKVKHVSNPTPVMRHRASTRDASAQQPLTMTQTWHISSLLCNVIAIWGGPDYRRGAAAIVGTHSDCSDSFCLLNRGESGKGVGTLAPYSRLSNLPPDAPRSTEMRRKIQQIRPPC